MQTASFNLVQTTSVLQKRWKTILLFVLVSAIAATITVLVVPPYFRSTATVVSANPALADKARLFNNHVQQLYSYFGTGDDLDRIYGIADMGSTYARLVDEFSLVDYYQLKGDNLATLKSKAAICLRKDIDLKKTEQNQLQIIAWTKNKELSASLVNRMIAIVQETATAIWQRNYKQALSVFDNSLGSMEAKYMQLSDSLSKISTTKQQIAMMKMKNLSETIATINKTSDEFRLGAQALPEILYVMEPASPAAFAERPDKPVIILTACLVAFIFSSLLVLVNDRKSMV